MNALVDSLRYKIRYKRKTNKTKSQKVSENTKKFNIMSKKHWNSEKIEKIEKF